MTRDRLLGVCLSLALVACVPNASIDEGTDDDATAESLTNNCKSAKKALLEINDLFRLMVANHASASVMTAIANRLESDISLELESDFDGVPDFVSIETAPATAIAELTRFVRQQEMKAYKSFVTDGLSPTCAAGYLVSDAQCADPTKFLRIAVRTSGKLITGIKIYAEVPLPGDS